MINKICFITSLDVNVGDEFIREGICSFFDEIFSDWSPYYVNKVDLSTIYRQVKDEKECIGDKLVNADIVVQAGAPVYWKLGGSTCYNVEWADELWFKRIFKLGTDKTILNIAAGACQAYPDIANSFLSDPACVDFALQAASACAWTSVRDPLASQILYGLNVKHDVLPCSAFHAARRMPLVARQDGVVGINLMPLGGHFKLREDIDPSKWLSIIKIILPEIRKDYKIRFIAHDLQEKQFMESLALSGEEVFHSTDYREYMNAYGSCSAVIANRVHGAVCAAGFGCPSIIIGNDSRLLIGDYIGLPSYYVATVTADDILGAFNRAVSNLDSERERLITLREASAVRYRQAISSVLDAEKANKRMTSCCVRERWDLQAKSLSLASVTEFESLVFTDFMKTMNCFAERFGLRQFTTWSKIWEYPWLWFNALTNQHWAQVRILDFGSEISPMPWFMASLGAHVTLVECDEQWIPVWDRLNAETGFAVDWKIVSGEILPFLGNSFDIVTSFSVIEHQGNKRLAVDEICRVLKPGGLFALSFDICEPSMGMTFPEWNGCALTIAEFESIVWNHPGFVTQGKPDWNTDDIPSFIEWHRKTAEHHNYVVGGAVLRKKYLADTNVNKILLPRFDTFGDLVLMEGFVEQLSKLFPAAEITMLVRSGYEQLSYLFPSSLGLIWLTAEGNPYCSPDVQEQSVFKFGIEQLVAAPWDMVVFTAFDRSWMDNALAENFKDVFTVAIGAGLAIDGWPATQLMVVPVEEKSHETAKYKALLSAMTGRDCQLPMPRLEIGTEFQSQSAEIINRLGLAGTRFVACFPAGTQNQTGKVWPLERYAELLSWVHGEMNYQLLLLGHQSETEIVGALASILTSKGLNAPVWLGGEGEIPILAGLFQRASLYVGNDTGPMHIAAAVGIPVVGVFGGGTFPRFLPVGARTIGVAGELPCFGCYWNCWLGDAPCMRIVTVDDAKKAVLMVLEGEPPTSNYLPVIDSAGERFAEFMQKCFVAGRKEVETQVVLPEHHCIESASADTGLRDCQDSLRAMEDSLSWRITKPLRWLGDGLR